MTAWIPMPDGCRLAARIWLPIDAERDPVPALLEYLPYRRRDGTAARDSLTQPWMAGHGYAAVRVDIRGTGDSDGLLRDEYDLPEMHDGAAIVEWLARQPWCDGNVGMWGISWAGFNALQVAALAPPALKAIIPIGFTHDRYNGDCHFMGGCLLEGTVSWGNTFFAGTSRPPDPAVVGEGWRAQWLARLDALEHPIELWLEHQRRDDYWKPGSVCEDFSRITAAVYAVSGWQDSYARNVFPLLEGLTAPKKALIGPWAHSWPHIASPGPQIGFLQEALRWWDHWLKGRDTGVMDGPMLRVWMGEWSAPRKWMDVAPGRWAQESRWPSPRLTTLRLLLAPGRLGEAGEAGEDTVCSPETLGSSAGYQNSYGLGPDLSDDQRDDDAASVCFDTDPLEVDLALLGDVVFEAEITSDRPQAMLVARLCEVAPDGASLRVAYGPLNLSHRDSDEEPEPLETGRRTRVALRLTSIAHRFAAGHRVRLALSTRYWPIAWPSPERETLTLHREACALLLPVRPADPAGDDALDSFEPPEGAEPKALVAVRPLARDTPQDRIERDERTGEVRIVRVRDRGAWRTTDTDVEYDAQGVLTFAIRPDDPTSARQEFTLTTTLGRAGWLTKTMAASRLSVTPETFVLEASLDAFEEEERVFSRTWHRTFKRDAC